MKKIYFLFLLLCSLQGISQVYFHDTQGKLDITGSGIATYTIPVALPPSIQNIGPSINLSYASGQPGGIAGQGWSISTISTISRVASRIDIDGQLDGVDFDSSDMLALDGQRLIRFSGSHLADGTVYKPEILSNRKVELKGSGTAMYFIVYAPDGSRSWYGNFEGADATDFTAYYITRFEDANGNFITYHYNRPSGKSLCISEIRFSANTNGLATPLNKVAFTYSTAIRGESGYIKGLKQEKVVTLKKIEVYTSGSLFRRYQLTHTVDPQLGYESLTKVQEFNGSGAAANPIDFTYDTTTTQNAGSEIYTTYANNIDFNDISLSGDFDGDGRLDFIAEDKLYTNLFQSATGGTVTTLPATTGERKTISTLINNKLNQQQSLVYITKVDDSTTDFKVVNYQNGTFSDVYTKSVALDRTIVKQSIQMNSGATASAQCYNYFNTNGLLTNYNTNDYVYFNEGDFDGNGISEILITKSPKNYKATIQGFYPPQPYTFNSADCYANLVVEPTTPIEYYILDLNPNLPHTLGSAGYLKLSTSHLATSESLNQRIYYQDFTGDGRTDILVTYGSPSNNFTQYKLLEIYKTPNYAYTIQIGAGTLTDYRRSRSLLFGDYNGDGKIDMMMPDTDGGSGHTTWHIYYCNPNPANSNATCFTKETHTIVEYWPTTGDHYNTQIHYSNYYAMDTNNDGKSDVVRVWRKYYKPSGTINDHNTKWSVSTYANNIGNTQVTGNMFTLDYTSPCVDSGPFTICDHTNDSPDLPVPVVSTFRYGGLDNQLVMVRNHHNQLTYVNFSKDVAKDSRLIRVSSSAGGIVDEIAYKAMEPSTTLNSGGGNLSEFYSSANAVEYPYVEMKRLTSNYLVSQLKNTTNSVVKYQDFRYHGLIVHLHGLGPIGFKKTARSAWYQSSRAKRLWNVSEYRHDWRGAIARSYTQLATTGSTFSFVSSGDPLNIVNSRTNSYDAATTANIFKLSLSSQIVKDYITGTVSELNYTYDPDYLLPTTVVSKNYLLALSNPAGTKTTVTQYENNPAGTGSSYYIGRVKEVNVSIAAYGGTATSQEKYTYNGNLLSKLEKRGNTAEAKYLVEQYAYNSFGNMTSKTISQSGYTGTQAFAPRVTLTAYDPTQRYIASITDNDQLVTTNVSFHPLFGLVTEEKNPYNLTTKTVYDTWGKTTSITDYLGKITTYSYSRSQNLLTTTISGQDGSMSVEVMDCLGNQVKKGTKHVDSSVSYTSTSYDFMNRQSGYSEPYPTGGSPTLWNTVTYDDYGRVKTETKATGLSSTLTYSGMTVTATDGLKTVSSTKNANGHMVSATDPGGSISYAYYPDGNLKSTSFAGAATTMEYDEWGRKIKLSDPSAGQYVYLYNALGELVSETTPNGTTTNTLDDFGKITEKKVQGVNTDTKTTYTYDPVTKLVTFVKFEDFPGAFYDEYYYEYDTYQRLWRTSENRFSAFFQRATLYDDFGRPEKEYYAAISASDGKRSDYWLKRTYKNGMEWQLIDDSSGKVLWQANAVNAYGAVTGATLGNGITISNAYDNYGLPSQFKHDRNGSNPGNVMTLNTTFNAQRGNLSSRYTSLFNMTESFQYDNLDRLIEYTSPAGGQVSQTYEADGRIKTNDLGTYNYSNDSKKYQNTSVTLSSEANPYYSNRDGIFTDDMEKKTGWQIYEPEVVTFDTTVSKTGSTSLKMTNTSTGEKIVHSDVWVAIDNTAPTQYTFSGWVKAAGPAYPQAEIFLMWKTNEDTGYPTQFGQIQVNTSANWVYFEKTVTVPATYKRLNLRLDINAQGTLYYDDLKIRKTTAPTSTLRELNISYNALKSPVEISETNIDKISFTYNYLGGRSNMYYGSLEANKSQRKYRKHYCADGSMEFKRNITSGEVEFITYIGGDGYSAPVVVKSNGTDKAFYYLHKDYLGSIVAITNESGNIVEQRQFDAWGQLVRVTDGNNTVLGAMAVLDRGYTGHEHLQSVGIVHMNGRLYDPKLHRFLQPDNFVQDLTNTQNYNRYGYVLNNPFKSVDTSGEELISLTAVVIGAIIAATTYTLTAMYADVPFTAGGFIKSAVMGAISGAIASGVGEAANSITQLGTRYAFQAFMHGATQGMIAGIQGGDFVQGFASGALSSMAAGLFSGGSMANGTEWKGIGGSWGRSEFGIIAFGTVSGGAGAALTKGNFWQGAATGLTVSLLNHFYHLRQRAIAASKIQGLKEYYALVIGESSADHDEAEGIGEVILRRLKYVGKQLRAGFVKHIGGAGQFDAIGGKIYNEIMGMTIDQIKALPETSGYYQQMTGASCALAHPGTNISNGAYFWNATSQKNWKDVGSNWRAYNKGTFVITAELGKTTFFKYSTASNRTWP